MRAVSFFIQPFCVSVSFSKFSFVFCVSLCQKVRKRGELWRSISRFI